LLAVIRIYKNNPDKTGKLKQVGQILHLPLLITTNAMPVFTKIAHFWDKQIKSIQ
jgi:hypothetical protein